MKKLLVVMLAMAVAVSFGSMAMAKDGLSVDLGFAMNFNGADMGKTIVKDGEDGAGNGVLLGYAIVPENVALIASKDANYKNVVKSVDEGGAMQGINTALRVRYDFLNAFFARLGFVYDLQVMGGDTTIKFTDTASAALATAALGAQLPGNAIWDGINTFYAGLNGSKITQTWTYGYWAIPITVGINVPVNDGKFNLYAGLGITYYSGYWQAEIKVPANYFGDFAGGVTHAAAKEKVKFEANGLGFNWTLGATAEVYKDVSLFIEWDATVAAAMSDSVKLKSDAAKLAFGADNVFYPVNLSTSLIRFGVNYKLPIAL